MQAYKALVLCVFYDPLNGHSGIISPDGFIARYLVFTLERQAHSDAQLHAGDK